MALNASPPIAAATSLDSKVDKVGWPLTVKPTQTYPQTPELKEHAISSHSKTH